MNSHFHIKDKRILIVDDNPTNTLLLSSILENKGFTNIHTASSAVEAYEVLEKEPIDVILMDILMPGIDGIEATKTIRSNPKYDHIAIIMVTATTENTALEESFSAGADDFVRKPVNQTELIARLKTILLAQERDAILMQHLRFDTKEEIINMLAHQWRQPLSAISSTAGNLHVRKALGTLTDDDLDESIQNINEQAQNLSAMISKMQGIFTTGEKPILASPNEAIQEVYKLMASTLQKNHIAFQLQLSDVKEILHSRNLLMQVVMSIISNAKEAFARNEVKSPLISISSFMTQDKINIIIEDNAGGISPTIQKHIFEPYFTTKEERNGKGLGLYLTRNIVTQQLLGEVTMTSKDTSTKFTIVLSTA